MEFKLEDVELARQGDQDGFQRLYTDIYMDLYRFAYFMLGREEDARDVVSDTTLDLYRGIRRLRNPEKFDSWVLKILSVKCKNKRKEYVEEKRRIDLDSLAAGEEASMAQQGGGTGLSSDERLDIRQAFLMLDETDRLIVAGTVFGGYRSKELGAALHMKPNTVRSRLSRGLAKMSEKLEVYNEKNR